MTSSFNIHTRDHGLHIIHLEPPRFSARVHIGELPPNFEGKKWTCYSCGADDIHFADLTFYDPTPTRTEMACIMEEAALYTEEECVTSSF